MEVMEVKKMTKCEKAHRFGLSYAGDNTYRGNSCDSIDFRLNQVF
jgi:hypothetical protein